MKILTVTFKKATTVADWQFVAETDDCMPDGNKKFSGFLTGDNGWKARAYIATTWDRSSSRNPVVGIQLQHPDAVSAIQLSFGPARWIHAG